MSLKSRSDVSYAKHKLPYPIYAADFDPARRGYLVVGGGGGESSTGIANQITVFDVSNRGTVVPVLDIDLSRTEDSVASLANLATKDGLISLAGINSSTADQKAGKNEHLRAFHIRYPPRKKQKTEEADSKQEGNITILGKRSFFKPSASVKEQTYQPRRQESGNKRIGAIASGLAQEPQIIVFNATAMPPEEGDVIARIDLPVRSEAADMDIIFTDDSEYSLAYCDDYNIHEQTYQIDFASKKIDKRPRGPRRVHQMALPDTLSDMKSRSKFRCLRFLNDFSLLALANKPNKKGAELRLYHLYPTGPAMEVWHKTLPSHIKQAASMDVCLLDADEFGNRQVVIAVAGQDISIEVFTTNYSSSTETFTSLRSYLTMREVHEQGMTQICFEPFESPPRAPDVDPKAGGKGEAMTTALLHPGPQYLRLASVSYANTVVVETFPLQPLEPKDKKSRYVLSHPADESFKFWSYAVIIGTMVLVGAILLQSVLSGGAGSAADLLSFLPPEVQLVHTVEVKHATASDEPVVATSTADLREMLAEHHTSPEAAETVAVVVSEAADGSGIDVDTHPDKAEYLQENTDAKHWDELEPHAKAYWKRKLIKAGQWAEHEGESVLKGVLWSTYSGFVGQVAGEILREL
ncbi:uncharacterized protein K489DRAFT_388814 [Dissoconium aciculare CBS 342.82]|uniref:Guanine nucleotide-exchange factor SEC12 n=1 Tax=Dissoconium aciculare CBS 342.82 TaxID=1314786 RepID=A0A6J3M4Y1_9PEZI|nr:uncharacterized protein K489DRAFT_388814 [Dissoconium aciculare CBS 342.82]KAF1822958.1 hypothetical protein K489DRAFT_388814 [Dissoconium aciculare CBS 342.82]